MDTPAAARRRIPYILLPLLTLVLAATLPTTTAHASLVLAGPKETSGTGLGAVNTVLTLHDSAATTSSGCVAYDGNADVVGPAACPAGIPGGDEHTQTQTRSLAEVGVSSAYNLRLVFNYSEPQNGELVDDITIADLELTLYYAEGSVCFASGPFAAVSFADDFNGVGTSGFVFRLDAQQAAAAQPCFAQPGVRAGLAAVLEGADHGLETFYLADAETVGGPAADLALTKTDSPDPVVVGNTLTYTLTATNQGPHRATGVNVFDTLPATLSGVSATSPDGTCTVSGRTVTCAMGDLAPGETATVTITGTPTVTGSITNTALVLGEQPDPDTSDNTALAQTEVLDTGGAGGSGDAADLSVLKTDSADPVAVGESVTYTIRVSNAGPATATGVTVTDVLPASVAFVSATVTTGAGTCSRSGVVVVCELGDLANGDEAVIAIEVVPGATGTITDTVRVSAAEEDPDLGNNSDSEQTQVGANSARSADLSVIKTASSRQVGVGQAFTYTIVVSNAGPDPATGTEMVDLLPMGVAFRAAFPSQGSCTEAVGVVTCVLGTIAAGGTASVQIEVVPTAPGTLVNTAVVSANESEQDVANNSTEVATGVQLAPVPVDVPSLGELGLALLALLLGGVGAGFLRRA
ncbi:MAG TPA: DUF11 domain-containing protein [Thermoanaerobaculia bacterium]|nr:DUF11 domain-containing protein [Thermoanaerobaculia bacterium]